MIIMHLRISLVFLITLISFQSKSQNVPCSSVSELMDIDFGISRFDATKRLLLFSLPMKQDESALSLAHNSEYYMHLDSFNVPSSLLRTKGYRSNINDSVFISQAKFLFPDGCITDLESEITLKFADDSLYAVDVEIHFPPKNLLETTELFEQFKSMLALRYPLQEEYILNDFHVKDVKAGEGIKFSENGEVENYERAYLNLRSLFDYRRNLQGEFRSTGHVDWYSLSFTIYNFKNTRVNGLGEWK